MTTPSRRTHTVALLERHAQIFANNINRRNFDINSPDWAHVSHDKFVGDFSHPILGQIHHTHLSQTLDLFRQFTEKWPEHRHWLKDVEVRVLPGGEIADVFFVMESTGSPPGQVRQSFATQRWEKEKIEGKWRCTGYSDLKGMADGVLTGWWGSENSL